MKTENDKTTIDPVWRERVDEIMDHFDFGKVQRVMEFLNWTWHDAESENKVPSEFEVRKWARRLLFDVVGFESGAWCQSGGFTARRYDQWIELSFVIESGDGGREDE